MSQADRIADLEAEVAYLRSELALEQAAERLACLRSAKLTPSESKVLLALYDRKRTMSDQALFDYIDHPSDGGDLKIVQVYISRIRHKVGFDAIDTMHSLGYRISALGCRIVCGLLSASPTVKALQHPATEAP